MTGVNTKVVAGEAAWIRCELLTIRKTPKWIFWEFIEFKNGNVVASIIGGCSPTTLARIVMVGRADTNVEAGRDVLVYGRPRMCDLYGLKLDVLNVIMQPSLGALTEERCAIRKNLEEAGIWNLNKSLVQPTDYFRVAVVGPCGSAGIGDFRSAVAGLEQLHLTKFVYSEVPFQGGDAAARISACLSRLEVDCRENRFDAVVLVRGGGRAADLTSLINRDLIKAICLLPIPVISGIGHYRDITLVDEVAHTSCGTPTRAALYIQQTVVSAARQASQAYSDILAHAVAELELLDRKLVTDKGAIIVGILHALADAQANLSGVAMQMFDEVAALARMPASTPNSDHPDANVSEVNANDLPSLKVGLDSFETWRT